MTSPVSVPRAGPHVARTIGLAAGGTGGHLFPAEALARELASRGHEVVIYTEQRGATYTQALDGLAHVVLPARSLAGGLRGKLAAAVVIARATWQARRDMRRRDVALMVGFGGYPSFAPALAAKSLGLPLLLHEQATRVSLANRRLLRYADALATSFADTSGIAGIDTGRITMTGNPVRRAILDARAPYPGLYVDGPLSLLVVGGSQSARVFGAVVPDAVVALPELLRMRLHLALQYAGDDADLIVDRLHEAGIAADIQPFFDDMGERLAHAHLVVTRAGASTAADLLTVGRPAIFVPIPHGGSKDEQRRNAETLAHAGAGWCVPESDFSARALSAQLTELFASESLLPQAAAVSASMGRPDAASRLADVVDAMLEARSAAPPA